MECAYLTGRAVGEYNEFVLAPQWSGQIARCDSVTFRRGYGGGPRRIAGYAGPTAGKTTLLRVIAGLDSSDAGTVLMDGVDVTDWEPAARDVAFVFQHFALYPDWSVRRDTEVSAARLAAT